MGSFTTKLKSASKTKKVSSWIVTENGVGRFDGVKFKNFQHDENDPASLPHNNIHDIAIDKEGRIWLALENGLCYYNPKEACFTYIDISGTLLTILPYLQSV